MWQDFSQFGWISPHGLPFIFLYLINGSGTTRSPGLVLRSFQFLWVFLLFSERCSTTTMGVHPPSFQGQLISFHLGFWIWDLFLQHGLLIWRTMEPFMFYESTHYLLWRLLYYNNDTAPNFPDYRWYFKILHT